MGDLLFSIIRGLSESQIPNPQSSSIHNLQSPILNHVTVWGFDDGGLRIEVCVLTIEDCVLRIEDWTGLVIWDSRSEPTPNSRYQYLTRPMSTCTKSEAG